MPAKIQQKIWNSVTLSKENNRIPTNDEDFLRKNNYLCRRNCLEMTEKIILGIDPGTNIMGYGLIKVVDGKAQMVTMGVIDLRHFADGYLKLAHIFERVTGIIDEWLPDEMAIEAPFFGKNVQSMLKLGRAQGVAIAAATHHGVPIHEYAPMKIKMALTGNGSASKEQVAGMLQRLLKLKDDDMSKFMDATDALGAAYCHYMQMGRPESDAKYRGWKDFINKNQDKISKRKQ
jgi:crossover junction endodeoxyribonuclease RuvC